MFLEFTKNVTSRCGNLIPEMLVNQQTGFRSVYGFSEQDAQKIRATGSSRNFDKYVRYSNKLFIDIDDTEFCVKKLCKDLRDRSITFQCYFSGKKGYHFHIPHKMISGMNIHNSHLELANKITGGVDESIYRPSALIRLPNTVHEKTGKRKELLDSYTGNFIKIENHENREIVFKFKDDYKIDNKLAAILGLGLAKNIIESEPNIGTRYLKLWSCAENLKTAGFSKEFIEELLYAINDSWENKKEDSEIQRCLKDVFKDWLE